MEPFCHEPLDLSKKQIRLIKVLPRDSPSDLVQCKITTFDIADCPKYCALSYTWGNTTPTLTIEIERKHFEVRQNLHYFLSNVVQNVKHNEDLQIEHLFVDQLCIDQDSKAEVNHLVQRMADIYSNAEYVVAWIGQGRSSASQAWQAMPPVDSWAELEKDWLIRMSTQPYWTRLWIVQELILAARFSLLFDGFVFSFPQLRDLMIKDTEERSWVSKLDPVPLEMFEMIRYNRFGYINYEIRPRVSHYHLHNDLDQAIAKWSHLACQDPRDKVYGLQGIVRTDKRIKVDYSKTAPEVFWMAMTAIDSEAYEAYAKEIFQLAKSMEVTGREPGATEPDALNRFHATFGWGARPEHVFSFDTWAAYKHPWVPQRVRRPVRWLWRILK